MAEAIDFRSNLSWSYSQEQHFIVICSADCYMNCYIQESPPSGEHKVPLKCGRGTHLAVNRSLHLRHSCVTVLRVQGVSPRVVMEVLGHSEIALAMNAYSHIVPELQREAAQKMQEIIER
jgi:hypothetical protein